MLAGRLLALPPARGPALLRARDALPALEPGPAYLALPGACYSAVPCRLNGSGAASGHGEGLPHGLRLRCVLGDER
jgi:hypothetical protein